MCIREIHPIDRLDYYAAAFHDFPCRATAERYESIAIDYAAAMVIHIEELENILSLVFPFLEVKQGPFA